MNSVLENLNEISRGDIITLRDFNTLEANGDEYEGTISEVSKWELRSNEFYFKTYGFRIEVDEDVTLMLLIRHIPSQDLYDYRLFRLWEETQALDCDFITKSWEPLEHFSLNFGMDDDPDEWDYVTKSGYPCYDVKKSDGKRVLLTEYITTEQCAPNFFAKHGFLEWYGFVGENGEEGLVSMWLGWDVGEDDFSIIKQN